MKFSLAKLRSSVRRFARDEKGVVTVEWVAIAGIFVVTAVVTFLLIGDEVNTIITAVKDQMITITSDPNFPTTGGTTGG